MSASRPLPIPPTLPRLLHDVPNSCYRSQHKHKLNWNLVSPTQYAQNYSIKSWTNNPLQLSKKKNQPNQKAKHHTYIALMLSVRLVSKERNCFPLFVKPLTSDPTATKIFSCGVSRAPPSSSLEIFRPGSVLNTGYQQESNFHHHNIIFMVIF